VTDHAPAGRNDVDGSDLEPGLNEGRGPRISTVRSSSVRLQSTIAFDLSVRCVALSTILTGTLYRVNSQASVSPTGPAPMISTGVFIGSVPDLNSRPSISVRESFTK
jgi:hypothetical protein